MEQKRVLLICDAFPPAFAPRMGFLAKYLKEEEWDVKVITRDLSLSNSKMDFNYLNADISVDRVPFQHGKITPKTLCKKILSFLGITWYKSERDLFLACNQYLDENKCDIIIASTWNNHILRTAYNIAKKYSIPCIIDLRDIPEQFPATFVKIVYRNIRNLFQRRNKYLKSADAITTVSEWHKNFLSKLNPNAYLIYNGYDPDIFHRTKEAVTEQFAITYAGTILSNVKCGRTPSLLFDVAEQLFKDNIIQPEKFVIRFYTDQKTINWISDSTAKRSVGQFVKCFNFVPAKEVPQILSSSSLLLLLADKESANGPKGIMTTKVFEYLAIGRNIICVKSDEAALEKLIRESNGGIAVRNFEELYSYLKDKYLEWLQSGYLKSHVNEEFVKQFSRKNQCIGFIKVMENLLQKSKSERHSKITEHVMKEADDEH